MNSSFRLLGVSSPEFFDFDQGRFLSFMECSCQVCPSLKKAGVTLLANALTMDPAQASNMTRIAEWLVDMKVNVCPSVNPMKCAKAANAAYCPTYIHEVVFQDMPDTFTPMDITKDKGLITLMLGCPAEAKGTATPPVLPDRCVDKGHGPGVRNVSGELKRVTKYGQASKVNGKWTLDGKEVNAVDLCPTALLTTTATVGPKNSAIATKAKSNGTPSSGANVVGLSVLVWLACWSF